ncbi:conserved hypothetical protein [Talaromyces stipitatus ATCC 10500]|uniref:Uncharacterized protein n=1 Tax=Talaromyces stipitatus (strain ATCC 10500 / CBS 375.48 / QM 6759 / NRRL 1006) TaxID=441959 RepID=B8MGU1_TALSN|nr:uncharacterized protein TSTA_014180 [Talaromyces stipitatus ATCC 10500]EED16322.1 conserved hypothetical protein [Talaromyces stipitatus ATCC 10500]
MVQPNMSTRRTSAGNGQKRAYACSPSIEAAGAASSVPNETGNMTRGGNQADDSSWTPRNASKRVRFSDPGPSPDDRASDASTGLTPGLKRTSLLDRLRSTRRRSGPLAEILSDASIGSVTTRRAKPTALLSETDDSRTRRRLFRARISDEMNKAENERRDLRRAKAQIASLSRQLEKYRPASDNNSYDPSDSDEAIPLDDYTMGDSMLMSSSPAFRRHHDGRSSDSDHFPSPEPFSPITPTAGSNTEYLIVDDHPSEELASVAEELAAARKEKQDLFIEWRKLHSQSSAQPGADDTDPPADFMKQIVPQLEAAIRKESDLRQTLKTAQEELTSMGFSGPNMHAILSEIRSAFATARLELENIVPGETAAGLFDCKATLKALVDRLRQIGGALLTERRRADSAADSHRLLTEKFQEALKERDDVQKKLKRSEESPERNAEDTLHLRTRLQELEEEIRDQAISIDRKNKELKRYDAEEKNYERLIEELEQEIKENHDNKRELSQQVEELEESLAAAEHTAAECLGTIEMQGDSLKNKQEDIDKLAARVEGVLAENALLIDAMTKQEEELGCLNARLAEQATELSAVRDELAETENVNDMLEELNKQEARTRHRIEREVAETFTKLQGIFDHERKEEQRRQTTSNIIKGENSNKVEGSEPSLPTNSPFKKSGSGPSENVRLGRGKDRRTLFSSDLDSGIGPSDHAGPKTDPPVGSDAFLTAVGQEELINEEHVDEEHVSEEHANEELAHNENMDKGLPDDILWGNVGAEYHVDEDQNIE